MPDRKELKRAYKESVQPMGIFRITNTENGRTFIGSALDLPAKKNSIFFQLEMNSHMNEKLQQDYNRFGKEAFTFEVIDTLDPKPQPGTDYREDLDTLLQFWIENLEQEIIRGYNRITMGPDGKRNIL